MLRPTEGKNQQPLETALAIHLSQFNHCQSNLPAAVEAPDLNLELNATLEEAPPHFSAVELTITGNYPDRDAMQKLITIAERGCIVANTIKDSVKLTFTLA